MKKLIFLTIILLQVFPAFCNLRKLTTEQLLDTLDYYVENVDHYDRLARNRIAARKQRAAALPASARPSLYREIGQMYLHVDIDSAMHYLELGRQLARLTGNSSEATRLELALLHTLPYKGMVHNSLTGIDMINPDSLTPDLRAYYYGSRHQILRTASDAIDNDSIRKQYSRQAMQAMDSLLKYLRPDHVAHLYFETALALSQPDKYDKDAHLEQLRRATDTMSIDDSIFALSTAMLAAVSELDGNKDDAIRYLAISAIGDIKQGNAEGTSLHRLGKLLHDRGENERAYRYLTMSLERSVAAGARIRALEAAESLPYVLETAQAIQEKNMRNMQVVIAVMAVLLVTVTIVLMCKLRRTKQYANEIHVLKDTLDKRNEYIRRLIKLFVDSREEYDKFELHVTRKIKAKQTAELLETLYSDEYRQKRAQQLQSHFDSDFLTLYPDFVHRVNRLLLADRRFDDEGARNGTLTPELRLLALLSLGVTDSQDLARILGLTLNTVYTYRTRIKSRAKDRTTFEENVRDMALSS